MIMEEKWKEIEGYEGLYEVSNLGRVRRVKGNVLKNRKGQRYYQVNLSKNGIVKQKYVHKLVAKAFVLNPDNKPEVDHINTDYCDNRVENLRWVTHKENMNNPISLSKQQGKIKSEEHKKKISDSIKGKHWTTIQGKRVWY